MKNQKKSEQRQTFGKRVYTNLYLSPLILVLLILPLIIRLKVLPMSQEVYLLWGGTDTWNTDFFSYYKGICLIIAAVLAAGIYFFRMNRENLLEMTRNRFWYIGMGSLGMLVLLSSMLSSYPYLSLSGAPDRYEGLYVWLSYLFLFFYTSQYESEERSNQKMIWSIFLLIFLMGIIGFSQYIGRDLFKTDLLQKMVLSSEYEQYRDSFFVAEVGVRNLYGTSYHYNYIGSLAPMMLAFSLIVALFYPDLKIRYTAFLSSAVSLFLLVGSSARSGLIALLFFVVAMMMFFRHRLLQSKKSKLVMALLLVTVVFLPIFGVGRELFYRLPSLVQDVKELFSQNGQGIHYREQIDLKNVAIEGDHILIQTEKEPINYFPREDAFYDSENRHIDYVKEAENQWRLKEPYEQYRISFVKPPNRQERYIRIDNGKMQLFFKETENQIVATNPKGLEISLEEAPSIGFEGKEKLGSSRGYIWSRTLPLLKKTWLLGYGADTFLAIFPQGDIYAKMYAYESMWTVVDKPHNLYLQMIVNFGMLFLLIFLTMIGMLIVRYFKKYAHKDAVIEEKDVLGLAGLMAVIAYLGAGFFNDSVLSVAPIFWVLFGLSIAGIRK